MRKILTTALLILTPILSHAHGYNHRHHGYGWVTPIIIGGVVGYAIANHPRPNNPPPVYIEQNFPVTCPFGSQPVFNRVWVVDPWGRYMQQNQFLGCQ